MISDTLTEIYADTFYNKLNQPNNSINLGGRCYWLGQTIVTLFAGATDFCFGSALAVLSLGALGKINVLNRYAFGELHNGGHTITRTYRTFLNVLNPSADFFHTTERPIGGSHYYVNRENWVTMDDNGIVRERFISFFSDKIDNGISSDWVKIKLKALTVIASSATIIIDAPISLAGATGAVLTGGTNKTLNTIGASHGLDILNPIADIFQGVILMLNKDGFEQPKERGSY